MNANNTMSGLSEQELLEGARNSKSSSPEMEELPLAGSPFKAVKEDGKWFAVWGKGKMTESFDTVEELLEWIDNNFWNFVITVFTMVADARELYKMEQLKKQHEAKLHDEKMKTEGHEVIDLKPLN